MNARAWLIDDRVYIGGSLDGSLPTSRQDQNHILTTTCTSVLDEFRHWFNDMWQTSEPTGPGEPPRQWAGASGDDPASAFYLERSIQNARHQNQVITSTAQQQIACSRGRHRSGIVAEMLTGGGIPAVGQAVITYTRPRQRALSEQGAGGR